MADERFALDKAVELAREAIGSCEKVNMVVHPDEVCSFIEKVHDKLIELTDKDGF